MRSPQGPDPGTGPQITVEPATGRFEDVAGIVGPRSPGAPACWCLAHRLRTAELKDGGVDIREQTMRRLCSTGHPGAAPGLVAYVGGVRAGWVGCGPRSQMSYVERSRKLLRRHDDDPWVIICVRVLPPFRGRGLTALLIRGAVQAGAPAVEAYPVDPEDGRIDRSQAYVGLTPWFEAAGFLRLMLTEATSGGHRRWLVRRDL